MAIALWISAPAQAEVFRCEDPEQGIIYQQTPCPEPAEKNEEEAESTADEAAVPAGEAPRSRAVVGRDQSVADVVAAEQEEQARNAEVEACKKQYRDAIDAIDLEIQNSYTPEQRDYYLGRLKALTDKMAAC
ncbi:MAG: hypothetical protein QNI96_00985 [Woeseiaceae bacterium]|nr:hypothetical protein [Woeseiaceae bacterium]